MWRFVYALILIGLTSGAEAQDRYGSSPPPFSDLSDAFSPDPPAPTSSREAEPLARYGSGSVPPPLDPPKPLGAANPLRQRRNPPPTRANEPLRPTSNPPSPANQPLGSRRVSPSRRAGPLAGTASSQARSASGRSSQVATGPQGIISAMLAAPANSELRGSPLTLAEVVAGAPSRGDQSRRIDAYWDLCASVADYYLGLREAEELRRLQRRLPSVSSALRQASRELSVRVGTSQKAAVASQERLASLMGRSTEGLPGDLPYCGEYDTKYAQIFPAGGPLEAQHLHELLPLRFAELRGAAQSVARAESWVQSVAKQPSQTGAGMIRALELLALNRRAYVQIAKDYNRRITRYTELSRPGRIDSGRLVAMLIGRSGTRLTSSTASPSGNGAGVTFRQPQPSGSGLR